MIKQKNITINGKEYVYTYSSADKYIVSDKIKVEQAYDFPETKKTYKEGEKIVRFPDPGDVLLTIFAAYDITAEEAEKIKELVTKAGITEKDWRGG